LSLLVENYFENKEFEKIKKILNNFDKKDEIYHWYKIKKIAAGKKLWNYDNLEPTEKKGAI